MLHLQRKKTGLLKASLLAGLLFFLSPSLLAQRVLHQEEHDLKGYYFGITLGFNQAGFRSELHPDFLQQDSLMVAEPLKSGGFALGLLATQRLSNRFELRFNPQLLFTERSLYYRLKYSDRDFGTEMSKKVESVITTFPLQLKFRSDRIGNFRVYMLGGAKVDFDLASNAKARKAEDMVKIQKLDYGVEGGMGFNFYFPSFILSPELKFSNGLRDLHSRDPRLNYSRVLGDLRSRMIVFSIHLEG